MTETAGKVIDLMDALKTSLGLSANAFTTRTRRETVTNCYKPGGALSYAKHVAARTGFPIAQRGEPIALADLDRVLTPSDAPTIVVIRDAAAHVEYSVNIFRPVS